MIIARGHLIDRLSVVDRGSIRPISSERTDGVAGCFLFDGRKWICSQLRDVPPIKPERACSNRSKTLCAASSCHVELLWFQPAEPAMQLVGNSVSTILPSGCRYERCRRSEKALLVVEAGNRVRNAADTRCSRQHTHTPDDSNAAHQE